MKPIIELIYDEPKFKIDTDNMIYEAVQSVGAGETATYPLGTSGSGSFL